MTNQERRPEAKPMYMRLCQSCAAKLGERIYILYELKSEPLKYCRCGMGGCSNSGHLALYELTRKHRQYKSSRQKKQSGGGERARASR